MTFHNCELEVLQDHISDHSPLMVSIMNKKILNRNQPRFKFLNNFVEDEEFVDIIKIIGVEKLMTGQCRYKIS